jgi:uncharacterized RDD family membrane protein YckC
MWAIALLLAVFAIVAALAVPSILMRALEPELRRTASLVIPIYVIGGVLAIICALAIVSLAYAAVGLAEPQQALGLPQGTVRAVIALSLLFIFLLASLYLYGDLSSKSKGLGRVFTSTGVTEETLKSWRTEDPDSIVSINRRIEGEETVYDVQRQFGQSETSEDFAKQILTTVSTLVVAIAGFYFGTRAVAAAQGAVSSLEPAIKEINPTTGEAGKKDQGFLVTGKDFDGPVTGKLIRGSKEIARHVDAPCSSKEIFFTFDLTNAEAGVCDLEVVNQGGGKDTLEGKFVINPSVTKVTAEKGKAATDPTTISIEGAGFAKDKTEIKLVCGDQEIEAGKKDIKKEKITW